MKKIYVLSLIVFAFISGSQAQVTVTGSTGANATYPSLTLAGGAFAAINAAGTQAGNNILINITADLLAETGANALNASDWTTLTINPNGGAIRNVSGTNNGPLIDLNGADNVSINGLNSGGNALNITNLSTGTSASTIRLISDATNNTITNSNILGSGTGATSGTVFFSTGTVSGNDNNTISQCNISASASGTPFYGIFSLGSSTVIDNSNISVSTTNISDFFNATAVTLQPSAGLNVSTNNSGWTITNNAFYQTATRTAIASNLHYGVFISNAGSGYTVSNNIIGGANPSGGGTAWTYAGTFTNRFTGIAVNANAAATTSIQNNTIANFAVNTNSSASTTNGNFSGIWVSGGSANIGTVTGNTIGSGTGNGSISINLQTNTGGLANLISYSGTGTVDIRNNIIGSITLTSSTATVNQGCQAILVSNGTPTIIGNIIGSTVTANSINSSSVTTSNANSVNGINVTSAVVVPTTISGNTIANINQNSTSTTSLCRGMIYSGTGFGTISSNIIHDISSASANTTVAGGATAVQGICYTGTTPSGALISDNEVYTIRATNAGAFQTNPTGIGYSNPSGGVVTRNKIYDIRNASTMAVATTPPTAIGLLIRAALGSGVTISNNMISLGNAQTTNTEFLGIINSFFNAGNYIYFNTINIEGTATAGALPSFCFLRGDNGAASNIQSPVNVKNNIFNNTRTGGTGNHYAIGNNYGSAASPAAGWSTNASNNNALNSASATTIGYWNTATDFATWKTASASDAQSISGYPVTFTNTAIADLHLNMGVTPTPMESGGVAGTGTVIDYDLQVRPGPAGSVNGGALAPDMGADEFDGVFLDLFAPVITYTLIGNTNCTTNKSFTASASDPSGVNGTVGTRPRVYYKRLTDLDQWNNNTSGTAGWKYAEAANAVSPFNFTIDYTLLFGGGGVVVGDNVQYFVVAQDLDATPKVAINSGTFSATPVSVALTAAAFPIGGTINSYNITAGLPTAITIGAAGTYTSLTGVGGLFEAINTNGLTGNTTVNILDAAVAETGAVALNQIQPGDCSLSSYTLLIKPNTGVTSTVTGNLSGALIRILSNNVTIDGSNNGTATRDLTITNTNVTAPNVVLFGSTGTTPIINSTLKNTVIINGANGSSAVVVSDVTPATAGYFSNITIQNNSIQQAYVGVYSIAVATAGNGSGLLITGNDLNTAGALSIRLVGVYVQGVDGATVSNNNISDITNILDPSNITGIWFATGTVNSTITGNTISLISSTFAGSAPRGIALSSGVAPSNLTVSGNVISGLTSSSTGTTTGIFLFSTTSGVQIQKNNISNIKNTNATGFGSNGIQLASTLNASATNVSNNFIFDIASIGFAGAAVGDNGYGIVASAGGGYNIAFNSINMNTNQTTVGGLPAALNITTGVTTAASVNIRNNILNNSQTIGTERYSIYSGAANTVFGTIDYNDFYTAGPNPGFIGSNRSNLAAIQAGFGGNTNSLNIQPTFISSTDLHLAASTNCRLDGYGTPIAGITTDYDNAIRDAGAPDMGADEFTTSPVSTSMATASVCDTKNVSPLGTTYIDGSCDLIARVLPSGGAAVSGQIRTCVTLDLSQQYHNGEPYLQRHYDLEPTVSPATATATLTLYFTNAEFALYNFNNPVYPVLPTSVLGNADPNRANVRITQFHGVGFGSPTAPGNYPGAAVLITPGAANVFWNGSFWEVTFNVTGFSGFYLHTTLTNGPLPVVVNYFNGTRQGSNHLLNWKVTCNSTPSVTMTLERSASSAGGFTGINIINATAARCNQPFNYTDAQPLKGMNYYRLKMVDVDGKVSYSNIVALLNAVKGFDIVSIAPNPVVNNNFNLNVASAQSGKMDISIFDIQGRLVNRQSLNLIAGYNSMPVNVSNLSPGTYTIKSIIADEQSKVIRFVKQ